MRHKQRKEPEQGAKSRETWKDKEERSSQILMSVIVHFFHRLMFTELCHLKILNHCLLNTECLN